MEVFSEFEGLLNVLTFGSDGWNMANLQSGASAGGASVVASHAANTHLDITGSGYFVGFAARNTDDSAQTITVQIDNGTIYQVPALQIGNTQLFLFKFATRLIVKGSLAPNYARYAFAILGDLNEADLTTYTPVCSYTPTAAHLANTIVDITGRGLLMDVTVQEEGRELRILVDGTRWLPGYTVMQASIYQVNSTGAQISPKLVPFQTSLKITTDGTVSKTVCNYKLA